MNKDKLIKLLYVLKALFLVLAVMLWVGEYNTLSLISLFSGIVVIFIYHKSLGKIKKLNSESKQ